MGFQLSKQDVFDIVNKANQELIEIINKSFGGVDRSICDLKQRMVVVEKDLSEVKKTINTQMVTEDYLDEKMSELRGDLNISIKKEDKKITGTVNLLVSKKVFSTDEANRVLA
jgi:hypothetical protein